MFFQGQDPRTYMQDRWLVMERYRLECAGHAPDGPHQRAIVAAIRSSMESLSGGPRHPTSQLFRSAAADQNDAAARPEFPL